MDRFNRLCIICLISCITATSFAGNRPASLSLSAGVGDIIFPAKRHIDNAGLGFFGVGYNFSYHWGIDSILGFFTSESKRVDDYGQEINGTLFALDALYRFNPYKNLEAYVMAGPGIIGLNPNGTDSNNEGNINAGLGVQYFFDQSLALRVEARDFYTITGGKNDVVLDGGFTYLLNI